MEDPITLIPCGHTVCRVCAYSTGAGGKTQCPECIKESVSYKGKTVRYTITRGFVVNFVVASLVSREGVKRQRIKELIKSSEELEKLQKDLNGHALSLPTIGVTLSKDDLNGVPDSDDDDNDFEEEMGELIEEKNSDENEVIPEENKDEKK